MKGKIEPVKIYELLGKGKPKTEEKTMIETFETGIQLYKQQDWDAAIAHFTTVHTSLKEGDFASNMYIERCLDLKKRPADNEWDGVFTMTTK